MQPLHVKTATEVDLQSLVDNRVPENRMLEYKVDLPGHSDRDKKEFLSDVSAFANASGGVLIFGMRERDGVASELVGITCDDLDGETAALESLLRECIDPRLPSVEIRQLELSGSRRVLLVGVARSWLAPHVVDFKKHWRFYSRHAAGKYPLDVQEIRTQFLMNESTADRLRRYRIGRLASIAEYDTPVPLREGPRMVLHILPMDSLLGMAQVDPREAMKASRLWPRLYSGLSPSYNLDGLVASSGSRADNDMYLQVFRSGVLEVVDAYSGRGDGPDGRKYMRPTFLESVLLEAIPAFCNYLAALGVSLPVLVGVALQGWGGREIWAESLFSFLNTAVPIDRDELVFPELLVQAGAPDYSQLLRPLFDQMWNAGGFGASPNYDEEGKRKVPR